MTLIHESVMVQETLDAIPQNCKYILDGTLGHGGHSLAMLKHLQNHPPQKLVWLDLDKQMIAKAVIRLADYPQAEIIQDSYANIDTISQDLNIPLRDYMILDLGVNMEHFKDAERGFSVNQDAQLDMRFDTKKEYSAHDLINKWSEQELTQTFIDYAEFSEGKAREIAQTIIKERRKNTINTTRELKTILKTCGLGEKAAVVIFQSIRIQVNQELANLESFLAKFPTYLRPGGRCAIMTYHSIEDRITKLAFKALENNGFKLYNKKVIKPHYTEVAHNRAARSAKYRIIEKL